MLNLNTVKTTLEKIFKWFYKPFCYFKLGYLYAKKLDNKSQANKISKLCKRIDITIDPKDVLSDLYFCSLKGSIFKYRKFLLIKKSWFFSLIKNIFLLFKIHSSIYFYKKLNLCFLKMSNITGVKPH